MSLWQLCRFVAYPIGSASFPTVHSGISEQFSLVSPMLSMKSSTGASISRKKKLKFRDFVCVRSSSLLFVFERVQSGTISRFHCGPGVRRNCR